MDRVFLGDASGTSGGRRKGRIGIEGGFMAPTMTLGGVLFGAGAGMYGCFNPPDSETGGNLLGRGEGVRILFVSPVNLGLSSQFELVEGASNVFSTAFGVETVVVLSRVLSMIIGGLGLVVWVLVSILGGGRPIRFSNGMSSDAMVEAVRGGPASSGVRNAFSQEPDLDSG